MRIVTRIVLTFVIVLSVSACANRQDLKERATTVYSTAKSGAETVGSKIKDTFGGKQSKSKTKARAEKRKASREKARKIASKYPRSEFPHTILIKPVAQGRLTSEFGPRRNPTGWLRLPKVHKGVDYAAPEGTAIYAAGDGVVEKRYVSKSFGNYIKIRHKNGFTTAYAHMSQFVGAVNEGTSVRRGQKIGEVGDTGRSTSDHLHFELHYNGTAIDPFFAQAPQ